jgi:hypothetical protein
LNYNDGLLGEVGVAGVTVFAVCLKRGADTGAAVATVTAVRHRGPPVTSP